MKVTMLVTGGLGGGISSSIAGGNFWNGFRQGVITSGLNHVAHLAVDSFDRITFDSVDELKGEVS